MCDGVSGSGMQWTEPAPRGAGRSPGAAGEAARGAVSPSGYRGGRRGSDEPAALPLGACRLRRRGPNVPVGWATRFAALRGGASGVGLGALTGHRAGCRRYASSSFLQNPRAVNRRTRAETCQRIGRHRPTGHCADCHCASSSIRRTPGEASLLWARPPCQRLGRHRRHRRHRTSSPTDDCANCHHGTRGTLPRRGAPSTTATTAQETSSPASPPE